MQGAKLLFLRMEMQQAQRQLAAALTPLYDTREAALIADWVMESLTGLKRIDRMVHAAEPLPSDILKDYHQYRDELLAHRPVQYVLHEAWFFSDKFYVDENVLIPRPETEELVEWVLQTITPTALAAIPTALLDVGTGSGCIAITLSKKLKDHPIHACDISTAALDIARRNATELNAPVHLHHLDFLDTRQWADLPPIQWLVSNPPYIPEHERSSMAPHVTQSEPSLALFVPDTDPLLFYRALAEFARTRLLPAGALFVEIHEDKAIEVMELFRSAGAGSVQDKKDLQGRDRMIKATW
jgi:release factor glutamine methyltransferase